MGLDGPGCPSKDGAAVRVGYVVRALEGLGAGIRPEEIEEKKGAGVRVRVGGYSIVQC